MKACVVAVLVAAGCCAVQARPAPAQPVPAQARRLQGADIFIGKGPGQISGEFGGGGISPGSSIVNVKVPAHRAPTLGKGASGEGITVQKDPVVLPTVTVSRPSFVAPRFSIVVPPPEPAKPIDLSQKIIWPTGQPKRVSSAAIVTALKTVGRK